MKIETLKRPLLVFTFICAWVGIAVIFKATFDKPEVPMNSFYLTNFFSYFTNQSNILVGLVCGYLLFKKRNFSELEQTILVGALIDISITFVIYQTILAQIWNPQGLDFIGNFFIHTLTPILFVTYWLIFENKKHMNYKLTLNWLLYPIIYLFYTLIRGPLVNNWYPYPFIDASKLPIHQIVLNIIGLLFIFFVVGGIFVAINNSYARNKQ